jgi:DNA modification methylase
MPNRGSKTPELPFEDLNADFDRVNSPSNSTKKKGRRKIALRQVSSRKPVPRTSSARSADKIELFDETGASRGYYSTKNRVNDLTGKEWVYWSKSVITKQYPPDFQHALRNEHGGQKPPRLCADLIRVFTKAGETVLDPFMGVGGTLLGASIAGRAALGVEINERWIEIYRRVCALEGVAEQEACAGDAKTVLAGLDREFDFVLTDVPYWNMDKLERSAGTYKKTGEAAKPKIKTSLGAFNGTFQSKEEWLTEMETVFGFVYGLLKRKGYAAVFIGEMYRTGRYHFLPYELSGVLERIGFVPKANLVWYDVSNSLHVYGYLYDFIPSLIHQNILVFRKE